MRVMLSIMAFCVRYPVGWHGVMELQREGEKERDNQNALHLGSGAGPLSCLSRNSVGSIDHQLTTPTGS